MKTAFLPGDAGGHRRHKHHITCFNHFLSINLDFYILIVIIMTIKAGLLPGDTGCPSPSSPIRSRSVSSRSLASSPIAASW